MSHLNNLYCKAAATHEAGHAIAHMLIGDIDIVASLDHRDICVGGVSSLGPAHPDPNSPRGRTQIAGAIFACLAGHVAEKSFWSRQAESQRPKIIANWEGDQSAAEKYASQLANATTTVDQIIESIMDSCVLFFRREKSSNALIRLAESLHSNMTLDDGEIRALVGKLDAIDLPEF